MHQNQNWFLGIECRYKAGKQSELCFRLSTGSKREANVKFGYGHGTRKKLIASRSIANAFTSEQQRCSVTFCGKGRHIRVPAVRDTARICWRSGRRLARRFIRRNQSRIPQEGRQGSGQMAYFLPSAKNKPEQSELYSGVVHLTGLEPAHLSAI